MDWTLALTFCEQVTFLLITLKVSRFIQIPLDMTGLKKLQFWVVLVRWSVLLVHQKSKSSVDCRGCHLFLLQDEALDSQDVILQFKVARKWKITEAGQCKCMHCTTFLENSLLTQTDPNRSSLTVFNMFQRFSLRPMRSFVRCFRVAWLLLNNWYKPQVRAAGRGRGDALTVSENRHERWSTRPTS